MESISFLTETMHGDLFTPGPPATQLTEAKLPPAAPQVLATLEPETGISASVRGNCPASEVSWDAAFEKRSDCSRIVPYRLA